MAVKIEWALKPIDKSSTTHYRLSMGKTQAYYEFSAEKNQQLIQERGISFEDVIAALANGNILDIVNHPNASKYPNQEVYFIDINGYVYSVPFVKKDKKTVFLKTIFPSRKMTKIYLKSRER